MTGSPWDDPPILIGALTRLEVLRPDHADVLLASASDPEVWRWNLMPRPETVVDLRHIIVESLLVGPDGAKRLPFLVRRLADNAAIGSTTLYDLSMAHRCVEMGETWLDR